MVGETDDTPHAASPCATPLRQLSCTVAAWLGFIAVNTGLPSLAQPQISSQTMCTHSLAHVLGYFDQALRGLKLI